MSKSRRIIAIIQAWDESDGCSGAGVRLMRALARHTDQLDIITLRANFNLAVPSNVRIYSLGKRFSDGPLVRLRYIVRFHVVMRALLAESTAPDAVFTYMSQLSSVLAFPYAFLAGVPVVTWCTHVHSRFFARVAGLLSSRVLTATNDSYRGWRRNISVIGHGIDTEFFRSSHIPAPEMERGLVICVGRIALIKRQEMLVRAIALLHTTGISCRALFVGNGETAFLRALADTLGIGQMVSFFPAVPYDSLPRLYRQSEASVSCTGKGSFDKIVIEACAAGVPTVSANSAFTDLVGGGAICSDFVSLAGCLHEIFSMTSESKLSLSQTIARRAESEYGLDKFAGRIASFCCLTQS